MAAFVPPWLTRLLPCMFMLLAACSPTGQPAPTAAPSRPTELANPAAAAPTPQTTPAQPQPTEPGAVPRLTQPANIRFASQEVGGGWYVYAALMAELLKPALPAGSTIDVLPHAAAIGNPKNVASGQAEIGFGFGTTSNWAYRGIVAYDEKMENLRALVGGLDEYYLAVAANRGLSIGSLEEIAEKRLPVRLYTVPRGGVGEFANRQVLEALGLSYEGIERQGGSVQHVGFNIISSAFREGRADLLMHTVNQGHPSMTEIATTADVEFLPLPERAVSAMSEIGWRPTEMPAGTFPKQDRGLRTVGDSTVLIASTVLPEDVAYVITKVIVENSGRLATSNAALQAFRPEEAWKPERVAIPLHPGAERYYRDRGWLK